MAAFTVRKPIHIASIQKSSLKLQLRDKPTMDSQSERANGSEEHGRAATAFTKPRQRPLSVTKTSSIPCLISRFGNLLRVKVRPRFGNRARRRRPATLDHNLPQEIDVGVIDSGQLAETRSRALEDAGLVASLGIHPEIRITGFMMDRGRDRDVLTNSLDLDQWPFLSPYFAVDVRKSAIARAYIAREQRKALRAKARDAATRQRIERRIQDRLFVGVGVDRDQLADAFGRRIAASKGDHRVRARRPSLHKLDRSLDLAVIAPSNGPAIFKAG